ncbi:MAG: leucine-rich repeat protein [Bacteroidaceae bacterium]|nr:leucine-rich repeat protein [Bacteroidaceae bacterium]
MKKIYSLLALGMLGAVLAAVPMKSMATSIVTVTSNSSSGIGRANLTATLDDGTVLGFYRSGSTVYFCGAISQQTSLTVPDSIEYSSTRYAVARIGYSDCDFSKAQSVTSLTLPATVTAIYTIPDPVKELHVNSYIDYVNSDRFSNLNRVFVPESTLASYYENTSWRNYVLINAEGTEPLKITVNMTKAGEFAQLLLQQTDNWYKVNELTVVGELNENDLNVFKRMKQLTKLDLSQAIIANIPNQFDGASNYSDNREGFSLLEELYLPEVKFIGQYAFAQTYRLNKVVLSKTDSIAQGAFGRLGASHMTLPEGLTAIGSYAFYASKLQEIAIPSSVTAIKSYCFAYSQLSSISLPASVASIGEEAFWATKLTSVDLPGVKTIGYRAFYECEQLAEVKFAEGLTYFGSEPFRGCTALTEIDLPSTFRSMTSGAFYGCTNIKKVVSRAVTPPTHGSGYSILYGCDKTDVKLYVPAMSIDKYRTENGWSTFYTILPLEEKTSFACIYDDATIDDATEFADHLDMAIDWFYQTRNGSTKTYCGALDYNGSSTLSMHNYKQYQYLGYSNSSNHYSYDAHFTSLIPNGTMRSDNVQTVLRVYDTGTWYFISLPYDVKVSDITYPDGTQFAIRKYSGSNRAQQSGDTWVNLTEDDVMNAYEGYILRCNRQNADFTFPAINNTNKNKVFEKESVVMPLGEYLSEFEHNRSWNLIGNPYPCYYDTRRMGFTAPITVWNRYYRRYDAYSPVDDSYILRPAQSFFVQRPVDQASITFDKAGRQKDATVQALPASAKGRVPMNVSRKIFNIFVSDGTAEDRTRIVVNEKASLAYELDKDASKFIADDNAAMLVYTMENGVRYAINERPVADGTVSLGFYAPADGHFTLSVASAEKEPLVLIDHETNTETVLSGEYAFTAKAGYNDNRFALKFGEATGISTIHVDNGIITAHSPYAVYTIDGRLVGNYGAGTTANLPKGIYVISSKDVQRKIVVK